MKPLLSYVLFLALLFSGCSQMPVVDESVATVNHVILLWLKEPDNLHHKQQIIEATESLNQIPGVVSIRVGEAIPNARAIVDDSFTIGIHMLFADRQAMEKYITHPEHTKTVNQAILPFVERIVIYDFQQ